MSIRSAGKKLFNKKIRKKIIYSIIETRFFINNSSVKNSQHFKILTLGKSIKDFVLKYFWQRTRKQIRKKNHHKIFNETRTDVFLFNCYVTERIIRFKMHLNEKQPEKSIINLRRKKNNLTHCFLFYFRIFFLK